jgi:hypothetical protein
MAAVVAQLMKLLSKATIAKKTQTRIVPAIAPTSGRARSRLNSPTFLTLSSLGGAGAGAASVSVVTQSSLHRLQ